MKKNKLISFAVSVCFMLIFVGCKSTKDQSYSGDFWKKHGDKWKIQKWHLEDWNELRPGSASYNHQKRVLDSLKVRQESLDGLTKRNLESAGGLIMEPSVELVSPTVAVINSVPLDNLLVVNASADNLNDEMVVFVSIEAGSESYEAYSVIVGCYKSGKRANIHLGNLKECGYSDAKIIVSKYGLNRVSIKEFLKKELAIEFAEEYRPIRNDVWVYTRTVE
jgi:hypothetical protein